jgi:hypothetical protein
LGCQAEYKTNICIKRCPINEGRALSLKLLTLAALSFDLRGVRLLIVGIEERGTGVKNASVWRNSDVTMPSPQPFEDL